MEKNTSSTQGEQVTNPFSLVWVDLATLVVIGGNTKKY